MKFKRRFVNGVGWDQSGGSVSPFVNWWIALSALTFLTFLGIGEEISMVKFQGCYFSNMSETTTCTENIARFWNSLSILL